jgi:Ca-activated chloride channel family protein
MEYFSSISFEDFHFLRPEWLWALIPLLILVFTVRHLHKQQSGWQAVLANHLYQHIITSKGAKKSKPPFALLAFSWLIVVLALAGPTWERLPQPVYQLNTGKVVLIDMSLSMRSTDIKPDRLTRAKYKAIDLVKEITEGETGLVAYAGDAFTISPLSTDAQNLTTLIPSLSPEIMPMQGSEPFLGLQSAIELLSAAGYQQGEIFWITDGVDNQQIAEIRELINTSPFRLSILGVGTEQGAPIQLLSGDLLKDSRGAIVVPKLSQANLKLLARNGKGRYVNMQADNSDIEYLLDQILIDRDIDSQDEKMDEREVENFGDKWKEMGPYLVLLLLPFAAYSFRRGLIGIVLLTCLLPIYTPQAHATWWDDAWKTKDQQGKQAFEQNDFNTAASKFRDPLWQGSALYKNQDYEAALEAFSQENSPQALYNQGNTLAQLGKLDEAIEAYDQVLKQLPTHQDAAANKALLEQLKEQQEQEKQQDDTQQNGEQSQDGDQQQDQQDSQQNGDQEQQNKEQQSQGDPKENGEPQSSESQQGAQPEQQDEKQQDKESESEQAAREQAEHKKSEGQEQQEAEATQMAEQPELTDEQKEQMQRMQTLLNRVPDDPAYLLKRKMQIESQQRKQQRVPARLQRNW